MAPHGPANAFARLWKCVSSTILGASGCGSDATGPRTGPMSKWSHVLSDVELTRALRPRRPADGVALARVGQGRSNALAARDCCRRWLPPPRAAHYTRRLRACGACLANAVTVPRILPEGCRVEVDQSMSQRRS